MKKLFYLFSFLAILSFGSIVTAEQITTTLTLTMDDINTVNADELKLVFGIGGARVDINQDSDDGFIVKAVVTHDSDDPQPTLQTQSSGDKLIATFVTGFDFDEFNTPDSIQSWNISIGSYDVDTELEIDGGGINGDVDLGGMPLTECNLNLGGATMDLEFSSPTSRRVKDFEINGGGINLSVHNIGNTDFEKFNMAGGGNIVELDFNGEYNSEQHDATIVNAGSTLQLDLPSDAGEKLNILTIATPVSVDGEGWNKKSRSVIRKNYVTTDYESQDVKLDFDITAVGSVVSVDRE